MDDLISRQAAIDAIEHVPDGNWKSIRYSNEIRKLPAAEPRPGKWIKNDGRYGWHCSVCGEDNCYAFVQDCDTGENKLQDRYCPNCGAKMEDEG